MTQPQFRAWRRAYEPSRAVSRIGWHLLVWGLAAVLSSWQASPALASASPPTEPPPSTLVASGRAAIYQGDLAGARERAVRAALLRGLERYAGLRIEASTWIDRGELIEREVRAHTHGYVQSFEVLDSRREGDELRVEVRLTVAATPVAETFRRWLSSTSTLLLVRDHHLSEPAAERLLATVLASPLAASALTLPSPEQQVDLADRVPESFYRDPDPAGIRELGLRWLAGWVVVADGDTRSLRTSNEALGYAVAADVARPVVAASGTLSLFDGLSGKLLATRRFEDHRGADAADPERAGRRARALLAGAMRDFLLEELAGHLREVGFPLRVVVEGRAAKMGSQRLAEILRGVRWVEAVELQEEKPGQLTLLARCRENPTYVVEELRQVEGLRIVHFDAGRSRVEVR